jgi:hypothetical protein
MDMTSGDPEPRALRPLRRRLVRTSLGMGSRTWRPPFATRSGHASLSTTDLYLSLAPTDGSSLYLQF